MGGWRWGMVSWTTAPGHTSSSAQVVAPRPLPRESGWPLVPRWIRTPGTVWSWTQTWCSATSGARLSSLPQMSVQVIKIDMVPHGNTSLGHQCVSRWWSRLQAPAQPPAADKSPRHQHRPPQLLQSLGPRPCLNHWYILLQYYSVNFATGNNSLFIWVWFDDMCLCTLFPNEWALFPIMTLSLKCPE